MMLLALMLAVAGVVPQQYAAGRAIPRIRIVDDSGRVRSIEQWKGTPTILVPMYTRCPSACPMITEGLKQAVAGVRETPENYRVVLFSFDRRDTPADLREFRSRHQVPLAWTMATANPDDVRRLLETLDVRVSDTGGALMHPNVAIALTPDLKTAKYMFGTSFTPGEVDAALDIARGGRDWVGRYGAFALTALLLVCIASGMYIAMHA